MTAFNHAAADGHSIDMSPTRTPGEMKTPMESGRFFTMSHGGDPGKPSAVAAPFVYSTPVGKNYKRWPFVTVALCAAVVLFAIVFHQLPEYRLHVRYSLYELFGSTVEDGEWVGGHREVVDFVVLFTLIGLPTVLGATALALGDALPPVPIGWHRTLMRFLKRKILVAGANISYAESIFTLLFLGVNAIWFAAIFSRKFAELEESGAADASTTLVTVGLTFGFNAVLCFSLLILPATRNCFWMIAMGIDYSHSIKYHRWVGAFTILLVVLHAVPYYKEWLQQGVFLKSSFPCFDCDVGDEGRKRFQNFTGQLAMLSCLVIALTSVPYVRRHYYDVFYYAHHLFLVVFLATALHFSSFVIWMYPGVCLYAMHRILSNSQSRVPCEVVDLEAIPGEITRLVFRRSAGKSGHYHAGQFVYLRVPLLSATQWHPFSISSSPIEYEDTFTVHVKAIGNWTKALFAVAIQAREERKVPLVYVDGFYGQMSDAFQHYPVLVFVAGGIGATPIISILGKVLDCMRSGDSTMADAQVYFHWTSREIGIYHEFEPLLDAIDEFDPDHTKIRVRLCFTGDQHLGGVDLPNGITLKPMDDTSMVPTRPFFQAARSIPRQMSLFFVTFTASFFALYFMRLGYPLLGEGRANQNLWPLQRFMEAAVMVLGAFAGWFVAVSEPKPRPMSRVDKARARNSPTRFGGNGGGGGGGDDDRGSNYSHTLSFDGQEVQFKHPVSRSRLNVKELMSEVVKEQSHNFSIGTTGIGTWVSGPMGLIHAVESEAKNFAGIFDVHYEEFEM